MDKQIFYTPSQTAQKLGISTRMLQYYRSTGRIEGIDAGNTTLYTQEQIDAANLEKRKPGPTPLPDKDSNAFALAV